MSRRVYPHRTGKVSTAGGFTLIELSIVLVIIGLVIGGILTGQELIKAAEIRKMGSELQQWQRAFNTFIVKYNSLPGDSANATSYFGTNSGGCPGGGGATGTCNGDGNGFINDYFGSGTTENMYATQQLSLAGFLQWNITNTAVTGSNPGAVDLLPGTNVPASYYNPLVGYSIFTQPVGRFGSTFGKDTGFGNMQVLVAGAPGVSSLRDVLWANGYDATIVSALDRKIDDGTPLSGQLRAINGQLTTTVNPNATCTTSVFSTPVTYLTTTSSGCVMFYKLQ